MRRSLFLRIVNAVKDHDNYFMQKKDGLGRLGLSTLQKVTAVFRILAYGASADSTDEYVRIGESTAILCSNNDINVFQSSNLFANLTQGIAPPAHYTIQGTEYNVGYYLADGIYPKWSTLVQTISQPQGRKKQYFAMMQETYRKDVERAFGVLQSRFAIVKGPTRFWDKHVLHDIMSACIRMHNMIVEDECNDYENVVDSNPTPIPNVDMVDGETERFQQFLARHRQIKNKEAHYALQNSLIEHLWERHGDAPCEPDL
ncbi:hypothetical protein HHK36_025770 [Tetracentron sinense]|uniref:Nuclease HARBI1 n=1 Tax=Tetracentron sinense TaxID=13715 RepID=A0A834YLV7_TETSI|nr:hypothetical protein HHK36_025770 [Tetracentron sinense]